MFYVYILQSISSPERFYIGYTKNLQIRLKQHNSEHSGYTNQYKPWKIKVYVGLESEIHARNFETYLKSQSGRAFIKKHFG